MLVPHLLLSLLALLISPAPAPSTAHAVWPLQPGHEVVHGFDPPDSAYGAGHRGVDLAGTVGEPVHAALGGRVTFAGLLAGRGVVVVEPGQCARRTSRWCRPCTAAKRSPRGP